MSELNITMDGPVALDLEGIRDEPVSAGWHSVEVETSDAREAKETGNPMICMGLRCTADGDPDYNRMLFVNFVLGGDSDFGQRMLKRFHKAASLPLKFEAPSLQALAETYIGRVVDARVTVKKRKDSDEMQSNVTNFRAVQLFSDEELFA